MPTESPTVGRRSPAKAPRRRIGLDVGGTNTDAVLLEDECVLHAVKTPTTPDVTTGVRNTLAELLRSAGGLAPIGVVMLGTTHFTNAVVQRRELTRVAAVRIGLPASASLEPFSDWPEDLAALVREILGPVAEGLEGGARGKPDADRGDARQLAALDDGVGEVRGAEHHHADRREAPGGPEQLGEGISHAGGHVRGRRRLDR